ncbi:hypothetical protein [Pseudoalteromonas phenolica]|uniref:hypothetical protein n=1 Tax=Pseudoalteromonas phenolica TaxID=161398 RepID=UPI000FFECF7C|nr:hypothetical protein [Pseudoalteromonas phenolica]RXE99611.1 hypothetical protein D9981_09910 [Pseudoalteromonas phenolica O-BC30]
MHLKDKIAIWFSAVAIIISVFTSYFQFFHEKSELVIHSSMLGFIPNKSIEYDLTFTNTGTLPIAITRIWGVDSITSDFEKWTYDLDLVKPFVIPPQSIVQKRVTHEPHVNRHRNQFHTGLSVTIIESDSIETHKIIWQNSPIPNNWNLMGKGVFNGKVVLTDNKKRSSC